MATKGPELKVQPFDIHGDRLTLGKRWERWMERFERDLTYNGCDPSEKDKAKTCQMALLIYAGMDVEDLHDTLPDVPKPADIDDADWTVYLKSKYKLNARFLPRQSNDFALCELMTLRLNPDESLVDFAGRLRRVAEKCDFSNWSGNKMIKCIIIANMKNEGLRHECLSKELSLDELLDKIQLKEDTAAMSKVMGIPGQQLRPTTETVNKVTVKKKHVEKTDNADKRQEKQCPTCGRAPHRPGMKCWALTKKCNKCSQIGHFAVVCPKVYFVDNDDDDDENHDSDENIFALYADPYDYAEVNVKQVMEKGQHVQSGKKKNVRKGKVVLQMLGKNVNAMIDTGSCVNIIDEDTYVRLGKPKLSKSDSLLYPFGTASQLRVEGVFTTEVESKHKIALAKVLVVKGPRVCNILSEGLSLELGLIRYVHAIESIADRYPSVFQGFGKMSDYKVKVHIDKKVKPVVQGLRRVPFALRDKVEKKLVKLEELDIIEPVVDTPTAWVSPVVIIPKSNGDVRLCVDMRRANEAVVRERYPIPTVEEVLVDLNESTVFSKLDMQMGFHQLELDEQSRDITTFVTHKGLFRYKRLMFGISSGPEIYQNTIQQLLSACEGAVNIADDILVHGATVEEHDERLGKVLEALASRNLTVNQDKCQFRLDKLTFMGHVLSAKGMGVAESKVEAVRNTSQPQDAAGVRSFLGLASYCSRYIADFETLVEPLRRITRKDQPFAWTDEQEKAFNELKDRLSSAPVLAYFNTNAHTQVIADASGVGLGAVLVQKQQDGSFRPVYYAARSLSDVERRYSQTEREALGLVWACERFQLYLIGREFDLLTDHKPLETIYGPRSRPSARIERWVLRLQSFAFKVVYIPGKQNIADVLSRLSGIDQPKRNKTEVYVRFVAESSVPRTMSTQEIQVASGVDEELELVRDCISSGNFSKCDVAYRAIQEELTTFGDMVLRQTRIVIPKALRKRVLELAHQGHQGIVKTKARLREKVWWPGIDKDCESYCKECHGCQLVSQPNLPDPVESTLLPDGPWQDLALDFVGPFPTGEYILVMVDYYSRYFLVSIMKTITTEKLIAVMEKAIDFLGLPYSVTTDNGPQFVSREFEDYLRSINVEHRRTTPRWAQANGEVERQNRTLLKAMRIAQAEGKSWRKEIRYFLRAYRTTPHSTTGVSPAELMFKRKLRTCLPALRLSELDEGLRDNDRLRKFKTQEYANASGHKPTDIQVGDTVLLKRDRENKLTAPFAATPYRVKEKNGTQITVLSPEGVAYKRNVSHAKRYFGGQNELPHNNRLNNQQKELGTDTSGKRVIHGGEQAITGVNNPVPVNPVITPDLPQAGPEPSQNRPAMEQSNQGVGVPEMHVPIPQRPKRTTRVPDFMKDYVPK